MELTGSPEQQNLERVGPAFSLRLVTILWVSIVAVRGRAIADIPPTASSPTSIPKYDSTSNSSTPSPPVANPAMFVASNSFRATWRSVLGATGYRLDVATNNSFTNYVADYHNLNVGNELGRNVIGLNANTTYYYRLRAYNGNGTSGNSNVVSVTTLSPTGPPFAITNPADMIQIYSARLNGAR